MIYNTKKRADKHAGAKSLYKKRPAGFKTRRRPSRTRRAGMGREGFHSTLRFGGTLVIVLVAVFCMVQLLYYGKNIYAGNRGLATSGWTAVIGAGRNKGEGTGGNGAAGPGGSGEDRNGGPDGEKDMNQTDSYGSGSNSGGSDSGGSDSGGSDSSGSDGGGSDSRDSDSSYSDRTDVNSAGPNHRTGSTDVKNGGPSDGRGNSAEQAELTGPGLNQTLPSVPGVLQGNAVSDGAGKALAPDPKTIEPLGGLGSESGPAVAAGPPAAASSAGSVDMAGKLSSIPGPVDGSKPMIAFTFDDGPFTKVDQRILDVLDTYGGRATFFIVGSRVNDYKDTLKRIHDSGSEIGNHTYNHKNLENLAPEEVISQIEMTNDAVEAVTGFRPKLVRVPYGAFKGQVSGLVSYPMIQWNIDTEDWSSKDKDAILSALLSQARDGSIILMHDLYPSTAEAFEAAIPQLAAQGYQFVTVSEMYAAKGIPLEAGQVYFNIHK